jgi:hypothetical protein
MLGAVAPTSLHYYGIITAVKSIIMLVREEKQILKCHSGPNVLKLICP